MGIYPLILKILKVFVLIIVINGWKKRAQQWNQNIHCKDNSGK